VAVGKLSNTTAWTSFNSNQ